MLNLSEKLWQASMAITAFAVLQGLAFLFIAPDETLQKALYRGKSYVPVLIFVYHLFFCIAIHWCHSEIRREESGEDRIAAIRISKFVESGQLFMVVTFGLFSVLTVLVINP